MRELAARQRIQLAGIPVSSAPWLGLGNGSALSTRVGAVFATDWLGLASYKWCLLSDYSVLRLGYEVIHPFVHPRLTMVV